MRTTAVSPGKAWETEIRSKVGVKYRANGPRGDYGVAFFVFSSGKTSYDRAVFSDVFARVINSPSRLSHNSHVHVPGKK